MFILDNQFRCPKGFRGRLAASLMNRHHEPLTNWGLSHVHIESDYVILDVGCGGGATVGKLAKQAFAGKVYGLDCSATMVAYSKRFNQRLIKQGLVEIVEGSVEQTGFADGFFDLVTAVETYYFWPDFQRAIQEIYRVLKPNGKLVLINEMVQDGVWEKKHAKMIEQTRVRLLPLEQIKDTLVSCGFWDVRIFTNEDSPWNLIIAYKP